MSLIGKAVSILHHDGIVIYPTDTIYGLGGDAFSEEAILRVYEAKKRPLSNPLSIAVCDLEMIHGVARVDEYALTFLTRFLPGPVTVVLPAKSCVPGMLTGGTGMIGIRFPNHPLALELISAFDSPVTATSANVTGAKDPVIPEECRVPHDLLIDGGRLPGIPSTVVDLISRKILRTGAQVDEVIAFLATQER
jgi:L-threonylcarbamoyladenylate synthase